MRSPLLIAALACGACLAPPLAGAEQPPIATHSQAATSATHGATSPIGRAMAELLRQAARAPAAEAAPVLPAAQANGSASIGATQTAARSPASTPPAASEVAVQPPR